MSSTFLLTNMISSILVSKFKLDPMYAMAISSIIGGNIPEGNIFSKVEHEHVEQDVPHTDVDEHIGYNCPGLVKKFTRRKAKGGNDEVFFYQVGNEEDEVYCQQDPYRGHAKTAVATVSHSHSYQTSLVAKRLGSLIMPYRAAGHKMMFIAPALT